MSTINDLLPLWLKENVSKSKREYQESLKAYQCLLNKESLYAKSIKTILDIKEQVYELWVTANKDNQPSA